MLLFVKFYVTRVVFTLHTFYYEVFRSLGTLCSDFSELLHETRIWLNAGPF